MMNRKFTVFVIGLITMASALLGAVPASAAGTWTIAPGGQVMIAGGPLTIYGPTGAIVYRCSSWGTDGQFQAGTGLPGAGVGTIMRSHFSYGNCSGQGPISVQPNWSVNADSYRSDWNWTFGTINARVSIFSPLCAGISPVVPFVYNNATGELWSNRFGPVAATSANECTATLGRVVISPRQTMISP